LTGLTAGTVYHFVAKSKDASTNEAVTTDNSFTTLPPPDNTPPVISSMATTSITTSGVTISWTTDEPATGQVEYGQTSSYGSTSQVYAGLVTSHTVTLTGLASGTTYHYRVNSKDASNNLATSSDGAFSTTAAIGYSRSNPAPIGTPVFIAFDYFGDAYTARVTVKEVVRGQSAWDILHATNMFNDPPPSGQEYVLVKIRFEYLTGPTPDTAYDFYVFYSFSSQGTEVSNNLLGVVTPDPQLSSVYPGANTEWWEALLVQVSDPAPVLAFERNYDGTGGIWFKLYS